jgi:hypothetical protein
MQKSTIYLLLVILLTGCSTAKDKQVISPGEIWRDTDGVPINAHGAGILFDKGVYYWYGEYKKGPTWRVEYLDSWECYRVDAGGVACYSSKDLLNWKNEGLVLSAVRDDSAHDLHYSKVIERPKVIYNETTKKYVMWMHVDSEDYLYARAGVAVSDSPTGPFTYLRSVRPYGQMSRDMTLFLDDDGRAWHVFSSEENATMYVSLLSDDYLSHSGTYKRIFIGESREAPAVLKRKGHYYLVTSGCTGWDPNEALYAVSDSMLGDWKEMGNPCIGEGSETTFEAQSTCLLPLGGDGDRFVFMADRWNKTNIEDSRYVWLPGEFQGDQMEISWRDQWTPDLANGRIVK